MIITPDSQQQQSPLFLQLFERLLNQKLQKFVKKSINSDNLEEIYHVIHETVFEIFHKCEFTLTEKSKVYVAGSMFGGLTLNADESIVSEHPLAKRVKISDLPDSDLELLKQLFVAGIIEEEAKKELLKRKR